MTLFTIENQEFGWDEVVIAGQNWGEWEPFVETVRQSLACLRLSEKTEQSPVDADLREAATAFRYAHNLISAEETRAWLNQWEMTVGEWMNCLRGRLARERWAHKLDHTAAPQIDDIEVNQVIRHHAICAGAMASWTHKLAGRAAVVAESGALAGVRQSPHALVAHIEDEFAKQCRQAVTPRRLAAGIADHRLDWIRFDCRYVWFPEERIAREASFCVIEDGLTLDEVAYDACSIVQHWNFYLDEIDPPVRPRFLSSRLGEWLGPIRMMEGFPLFCVLNKTMPAADDPQVRSRAEQVIIGNLVDHAINQRVKWAT